MDILFIGLAILSFWFLLILLSSRLNRTKKERTLPNRSEQIIENTINEKLKVCLYFITINILIFSAAFYEHQRVHFMTESASFKAFCLSLFCLFLGYTIINKRV